MFDRYLPLMKEFHVDSLFRRYQFPSIPASAAAANMVYTTHIMLEFK